MIDRRDFLKFGALALSGAAHAQLHASSTGQTGLINMPDGRIAPDGTLRLGLSNTPPYRSGWASLSVLPRLEVSARYVKINGVPSFGEGTALTKSYGDYKDKTFDGKVLLLSEGGWTPSLAAGIQDLFGTGIFRAGYLAASKQVGPIDATVGYGVKRLDGVFGGVRFRIPGAERFSLVAEYDGYDYSRDKGAAITGVDRRTHGVNAGVEYRGDSFALQASRQNGTTAYNAYFIVPLEKQEFVPKINEPEPYTRVTVRPTAEEWGRDPQHVNAMIRELGREDFRAVHVGYSADHARLDVSLTNVRISQTSRAIGRAARVLVALSPEETREIRIAYTLSGLTIATYTFFDVERLKRYFDGLIDREELAQYVHIDYAEPPAGDMHADNRVGEMIDSIDEVRTPLAIRTADRGDLISLRYDDNHGNRAWFGPAISGYFNDPSGAFRFGAYATGNFERKLAERTYLRAAATYAVYENISDVTTKSDSVLPHVRSDIAEYTRGSRFKLDQLLVNRFDQPAPRIYTRMSAGLYEMMYGGAGGQVLYLPQRGPWAADFAADFVRQRDFRGLFGLHSYQTLTAIGSVHYRMPYDMTATLRVGRFLARDEGARVEVRREFKSGISVGAWYTKTNGKDITGPGTPSSPYNDKGVFVSIPLGPMLTKDTQAASGFSLSPWTRDVGQMLYSPGDLYEIMRKPLLKGIFEKDGLHRFGDVDDDYPRREPHTFFDMPHGKMAWDDTRRIVQSVATPEFWGGVAVAGALVLGAMPADKAVDNQVKKHQDSAVVKATGKIGSALPLALAGVAGAASVFTDDDRVARAGYDALRAGVVAYAASTALRYGIGRSRPTDGKGSTDFHPGRNGALASSLPSNHVATAFALVTPIAEEFDMPWLYGVAGLTSLGRVAKREHWVSDTIAGALVGFAAGNALWSWNRDPKKKGPDIAFNGRMIEARWEL